MPRVLHSLCWGTLAAALWASTAQSQVAFRSAAGKTPAAAVQNGSGSPRLTLYGGLATGDNAFELGPALGASFNWSISGAPFNLRIDPYFSYHEAEGDFDGSVWFLGTTGNLELAFRASGTDAEPYLFGGGGFYFRNVSIDDESESDLTGAFGLGGGVRFGGFTLEAKMQDIDEFTNVAFLIGFMLGGR
ncbi:MAG TPA: hypothetical protein VJ717_11145 [Gemmatimonadaceae bacterium]|nr:hypothetical protein [Gemmatimonadaceae bacterium]